MAISLFSFFSGSGLLDLGFENENLDFNVVFVNEYHQSFLNAYVHARQNHHVQAPVYGYHCCDINNFITTNQATILQNYLQEQRDQDNIVGFIGGPPCPDFSVGGKNRGRNGQNGVLAQNYVELIIAQQPDFFIFENVRGLVRTAKHREYFGELKSDLINAGYIISETIINSLSFGVPQDRDRVIMIGILNNRDRVNIPLIDGKMDFPWLRYSEFDADTIKHLPWPTAQPYIERSRRQFIYPVPQSLTIEYWFTRNNVVNHPNSRDVFRVRAGREKMMRISEGDTSRKSFKRLHRWRYSPTAAYGNNEVHLHPYETRRISIAEAMAIQSLPEWFCLPEGMPLTHKFKTIGNGVPYLMAFGIARAVNDFLNEIYD
jgi:DNA (cytosine-5)-methyltransferase 1